MKEIKILKMKTSVTNTHEITTRIIERSVAKKKSIVCVSNVHMCMETYKSKQFRNVVNTADFVVADGRPIYWAQKILGHKEAEQTRGQDLVDSICNIAKLENIKIGLYGGINDEHIKKIVAILKEKYQGINIVYYYSPPFRNLTYEEKTRIYNEINIERVDILFVGVGCPKQENWMFNARENLNCTMIGVGAVFDFISGDKKHAPVILQKLGLEWLFRLVKEPRRLFPRYIINNPLYIILIIKQIIFAK